MNDEPQKVCTYSQWGNKEVGVPCTLCGHNGMVHPGMPNPSLSSCVICEMEEFMGQETGLQKLAPTNPAPPEPMKRVNTTKPLTQGIDRIMRDLGWSEGL